MLAWFLAVARTYLIYGSSQGVLSPLVLVPVTVAQAELCWGHLPPTVDSWPFKLCQLQGPLATTPVDR